ncbi:MAG: galactokinase [Lachnoclostridium sp.]|nr:galactokinase [Lachnoclostridium sp.]
MKPTLFVLAAGMGSRYGGLKQLDPLGPQGQTIMDYSIFDAIRAGFGKVVFVIRKDFEKDFREKILSKYKGHIPVEVVFQSTDKLPEGYTCPPERTKPWGTNHAVMMGAGVIKEPFAVINADDFYGRDAFRVIAEDLMRERKGPGDYSMVGFRVGNTLTENGSVSRGVCTTDDNSMLTDVVERTAISYDKDGRIVFTDENGVVQTLDPMTPVSMNLWGFTPDYFDFSDREFRKFLDKNLETPKAEFFIPLCVDTLINNGEATVRVLDTDSRWFGVTYAADRPGVVEKLAELHAKGEYPDNMFGSSLRLEDRVKAGYAKHFHEEGNLYASAGRINLIGEHTDYNGGYVFPGAIDKVIMAEIRPNGTYRVNVYSVDLDEYAEFGLTEADAPSQQWARYIFGVCREIAKRGFKVAGFDAAFGGNIPLGAGLSSSAALESCFAFALNDLFNDGAIPSFELAKIGQSTEHNYCGVNCGIMDQFASVFGKKDCLIRLDCRSLEYEYFPFKIPGYRLVLLDSVVKHELVDSPYNKRRESCERVAARLGVETLRDATMEMLDAAKADLSDEDYRRARFVIGEKERVLEVCDALNHSDINRVGQLMYATHDGLSKDYEVSCEELDYLVDIARECGVTGSRIMGGGFGGCTINLVAEDVYDNFIAQATEKFKARYGHAPKVYDVVISDGARRIS